MPDPNAALGISQLKRIESIVAMKNQVAKYYGSILKSIEGIVPPIVREYNRHTFMLYAILTKNNQQREKIRLGLEEKGIETRINFPPMHLQPIYTRIFGSKKGMFPVTEDIAERILGLPIFIKMTQEQQVMVVNSIKEIIRE